MFLTWTIEDSEIFNAFEYPLDSGRLLRMTGFIDVFVAHHFLNKI
jgi:hypothetical protein